MAREYYGTFACRECGQEFGDPRYKGPEGHAPDDMCWPCWFVAHMEQLGSPLGNRVHKALRLWAEGYTQAEAAAKAGVSYGTFRRRLKDLRNYSENVRKN